MMKNQKYPPSLLKRRGLISILLIFFSSISFAQNYDVIWANVEGADYDTINNTITKTTNNGWKNSGARSYNRIKRNQDGIMQYTITDLNTRKAFGLATKNNAPNLKSIDYAFMQKNNKILIVERGKIKGFFGKVNIGDILTIERDGNKIRYKKNGVQLRKRNTNPYFKLFVDVSIFTNGASISGLKSSFGRDIRIKYTKQDVDCIANKNIGSIILDIRGGIPPITILWNTGQTTENITSLSQGQYTVTVTDQLGQTDIETIDINNAIEWTKDTGVTINGGIIQKTTSTRWGNSGASSYNTLKTLEDGYLSLTINNPWTIKAFGFSDEDTSAHFNSIDYCYLTFGGRIFIFSEGKYLGRFGRIKKGTILKIERKADKIHFTKNGNIIYTLPADNTKELIVDFALFTNGSILEPIYTSFCFSELKLNYTTSIDGNCFGTISLEASGGLPPYTYEWADGSTNQTKSNLIPREYHINVIDASGTGKKIIADLLIPVEWTDFVGTEIQGDSLVKIAEGNWGTGGAASINKLNSNEDGYFKYTIVDNIYERVIGFSSKNTDAHYKNMDYCFFIKANELQIIEKGVIIGQFGKVVIGDNIKIERKEKKIVYYLNNKWLYSSKYISITELVVDVALLKMASYFGPVQTSFCEKPEIFIDYTTVINEDCQTGSIYLTVTGGVPPFTYNWFDKFTTQNVENLPIGTYTVTVTDDIGSTKTETIELFPDLIWTDLVGVEQRGDTLIKTVAGDWGTGGAASENILLADQNGYVSCVLTNHDPKCFGLSSSNIDAHFKTIDYCFYSGAKGIFIYEKGKLIGDYGLWKNQIALKIEKIDNKIYYRIDGKLVRAIEMSPTNLIADVALFNQNSYFVGLNVSFCKPNFIVANYSVINESINNLGSINLNILSGTPPYSILWSDEEKVSLENIENVFDSIPLLDSIGITEQEIFDFISFNQSQTDKTNIHASDFLCKIIDSEGLADTLLISVGQKINWGDNANVIIRDNNIESTIMPDGWGNSQITAYNTISTDANCYIKFIIKDEGKEHAIGFRNINNPQAQHYEQLDYAILMDYQNNLRVSISGILLDGNIGDYSIGDNIKMELSSNTNEFLIFKNNQQIFQTDIVPETYYVDFLFSKQSTLLGSIVLIPLPVAFGIHENITDALCSSFNSGSIDITVNMPWATNITYNWTGPNAFNSTLQDIANLEPGEYQLSLTYYNPFTSSNVTVQKVYTVGYILNWDGLVNLNLSSPNKITSTSNILIPNNATSSSLNVLEENTDGWVEFTHKSQNAQEFLFFGLSHSISTNNFSEFDNGFIYLKNVFNSNTEFVYDGIAHNLGQSDNYLNKFKIKRIGNQVFYYKNEQQYLTPISAANLSSLYVNVYILTPNTAINHTRVSFRCPVFQYYKLHKQLDGGCYLAKGCILPFTFIEEYNDVDNILNYKIYKKNSSNIIITSSTEFVQYGDNRYSIDISSLNNNEVYTLEILNEKNEKWYLRFKKTECGI